MKSFQCQNCGQLLFFENTQCLHCGYQLGYIPEAEVLSALNAVDNQLWQPLEPAVSQQQFRLCANYAQENVCNWLILADDPHPFCRSCRLNQTIPNLDEGDNREL